MHARRFYNCPIVSQPVCILQFLRDEIIFPFCRRERPSPLCYLIAVMVTAVTLNARKFFEFQLNSAGDDFETTSIMEYPTYTVVSR